MKYQHVRRTFRNPFYVYFKKQFCPDCHQVLNKTKVFRIVHSDSPEAAEFDFSTPDTFMVGNVKFIWTEFECPACRRRISIDEMRRIERCEVNT